MFYALYKARPKSLKHIENVSPHKPYLTLLGKVILAVMKQLKQLQRKLPPAKKNKQKNKQQQ